MFINTRKASLRSLLVIASYVEVQSLVFFFFLRELGAMLLFTLAVSSD